MKSNGISDEAHLGNASFKSRHNIPIIGINGETLIT